MSRQWLPWGFDAVNVGEPAIAIGSPLGTEFATSVTQGIISAKNRSVSTDVDSDGIIDWDVTALQTDAAINPGNSEAGALINIAGQVIGINSMKISDQGWRTGYGNPKQRWP